MKPRLKAQLQELAKAEPDLPELSEEFQWCVSRRDASIFRRQRLNYNTRYCIWPNQTHDGRKWYGSNGEDPFPWKGASDARVNLIDMYINQDVAADMVVWRNMRTLVTSNNGADPALGVRLTQVLRWMKYTQMKESRTEARLLDNYRYERGAGVLGIFWEKRSQLGYDTVDLESLQVSSQETQMMVEARAQQGGGGPDADEENTIFLPRFILDPSQEDKALAIGVTLYPDVKKDRLRKAIQDLRNTGHARFPRPYLVMDRPTVVALAPNEDVFLPPETTDLQRARSIFRRELLTESELRERVHQGWDEQWIEEMIEKQRGAMTMDFDGNFFRRRQRDSAGGILQVAKLFEVIHGFQRLADEEGVPGIYYTVFNPNMAKKDSAPAFHELLNYDHGEYPFVMFEREKRGRLIDDARGYGEIGATWQTQIKTEWDSRVDLASIRTLPPSYHPEGQPPDQWGPGVQIPTSRPDDYGFMEVPQTTGDVSREVQQNVREFADEYFGRSTDPTKAVMMGIVAQDRADLWLDGWMLADTQILQLMQQFMPDTFYFRVVGSSKGRPIHATREEIQGEFDITLSFNTKTMDPEYVAKEMGLIEKALAMDVNGRIDRDEVLNVTFELIDPNMGERLIKPGEEASQHEIEDEQNVFTKIWSGIAVDVKPGQAYQMRLQWLQNMLANNPAAQQRYKMDEQFRELLDRHIQQLKFQIDQRQINPVIGKLGSKPSPQNMPSPF